MVQDVLDGVEATTYLIPITDVDHDAL